MYTSNIFYLHHEDLRPSRLMVRSQLPRPGRVLRQLISEYGVDYSFDICPVP
jgi:hypothetical protein